MSIVMDKYLKTVNSMSPEELKQALIRCGVEEIAQTEEIYAEFFGNPEEKERK